MIESYHGSPRHQESKRRIENAFNFVDCDFDDVPIIIQTPSPVVNGQDHNTFPDDYYENPNTMLEFQVRGYDEHLQKVADDYIPYLWPFYGVCVVPEYYGSPITFPRHGDPAAAPAISTMEEAKNLRLGRFEDSDLMKRTLETIRHFQAHSDYPVSVTDTQSILDCISQIVGYQNLFYWMQDDPGLVHALMDQIGNTIRDWVRYQKRIIGENDDQSNGIICVNPPSGVGAWFSDDDMTLISPEMYEEFVVQHHEKLFGEFGQVIVHWCGNGNHNADNIAGIESVRAVHNLFLGEFDIVAELQEKLSKHNVTLITGDFVPVPEQLDDYLRAITENLDPRGLILCFWICPRLGLRDGRYMEVEQDPLDMASRILEHFRG